MRSERVVGGRHAVEQRILLGVLNAKPLQVRSGLGHLWKNKKAPAPRKEVKQ